MTKRVISIILSLVMLTGSVSVLAASGTLPADTEIIVNETFEDCVENATHDTITMDGLDSRIVTVDGDKAIYSNLWATGFLCEIPLSQASERMVYSFDIKADGGAVSGKVMNLSTSTSLLKFNENGSVTLEDGYQAGGYKDGRWHSYTAVIDYSVGCYSLYVDSKCLFQNRLFNVKAAAQTNLSFVFKPVDDDVPVGLYIDNVRVYTGTKALDAKLFPAKTLNTESIEFEPTETKPSNDRVFINTSGRNGFDSSNIVFQAKQDTEVGWGKVTPNGPEVIKMKQTGKTDCFTDIKVNASDAFSLVVQADVYIASMETTTMDLFRTNGNGYSNLLTLTKSGLTCNSTSLGALPKGEWVNIAIACDFINGTGDVYINGVLKRAGIALHSGGVRPTYVRIAYRSITSAGNNEVYINNYKMYEGTEPRELEAVSNGDSVDEEKDDSLHTLTLSSIQHSKASGISKIGKASMFMTLNEYYFMDGKKQMYPEDMQAYDDNGVAMVPADLVAKAFDATLKYQDNKIISGSRIAQIGSVEVNNGKQLDRAPVEKNGVVYVPVASFAQNVLAKYAYEDSRGFAMVADSKLDYSNSASSSETMESSDIIYRYMLYDRPTGDEIYDAVVSRTKGEHPRMFITKDEIPALRAKVQSNDALKAGLAQTLTTCEGYMNEPPLEHKLTGIRLIEPCQQFTTRIMNLTVANLVTGDDKYLDRMWEEAEYILSWPDLNADRHYLDTGEIAPGLAIAYDMLYNHITPAERKHFREEMVRLFFDIAVGMFTGTSKYTAHDTRQISSNWGAVVGSGLLMCALSFIDSEPEESEFTQKCKFLAENALQSIEIPFGALWPDGAINEGIGYWTFYIESLGWATQSVIKMCGDDYGLLDSPGYEEAVDYQLYVQSPNGYYCYASSGHTTGVGNHMSCNESYLISKFYNHPQQMEVIRNFNESMNTKVRGLGILWYEPCEEAVDVSSYPLDKMFKSMQLSSMKAAWGDDSAAWVGTMGGENHPSNSHWDKGSFIYEDDGVRWFHDLGSENYDLPGGTHGMDGATLYMKRAEGHNCIVINPEAEDPGQVTWEYAPAIRTESKPRGAITVYDLTDVYSHRAKTYKRGFYFGDNRNSLVVQDELELLEANSDLYHFLTTTGKITIGADGKTAYIDEEGLRLKIEYICDIPNWHLEARDASSLTPEIAREGEHSRAKFNKIALVAKASGKVNISIKCTVEDELETYSPHSLVPMDQWTLPDGEIPVKPSLTSIMVNGEPIEGFSPMISEYSIALTADTPIPEFTATSADGSVQVIPPESLNDVAKIIVSNDGGKRSYRVKFEFIIRESEALMDTKPVKEVPAEAVKLDAAWCYASHNPQPANCDTNAVDGNMETRWSSNVKGNFLEVDVGEVKDISGIAFAYMDSYRFYQYDILVSEDKINYTKVYSGTSGGFDTEWEYLPLPVKARYVRYVGYGHADGEWNSIVEFRPCSTN